MKAKSRSSRLVLPYPVLRKSRLLLDQQLWCLGWDVRQPDFPLAELGLRFLRRPERDRGCSRLTAPLPQGGHLSLWGFGVVAQRPAEGAIWIRRLGFRPLLVRNFDPLGPCWEHRDFNNTEVPSDSDSVSSVLSLLQDCAGWFAGYEAQVQRRCGESYRVRCLSAWTHKNRAIPSAEMAETWAMLEETFRQLRHDPHPPPATPPLLRLSPRVHSSFSR